MTAKMPDVLVKSLEAVDLSTVNFDDFTVDKLRQLMWVKYPTQSKFDPDFVANANRDECLRVLKHGMDMAEVRPEQEVRKAKEPAMPEPGVGGEVPPVEAGAGKVKSLDEIARLIDPLMPEAAVSIRCAITELEANRKEANTFGATQKAWEAKEKDLKEQIKLNNKPPASKPLDNGQIRLCDVEAPVICKDGDKAMEHVPAVDPMFDFGIWRASIKVKDFGVELGADTLLRLLIHPSKRPMLVGPPGCGKTKIVEQFCAHMRWPMVRFNGNHDVTISDFVGCYQAKDGSTYWTDGPLAVAMKIGAMLVLDESDHMPAECSSVLHSVLEPGGKLLITQTGEVVSPHVNFRIIATANTAGFGDESGLHPNAKVQDHAFLSRLGQVLRVVWPTAAAEAKLLRAQSGIDKETAGLIVAFASDSRLAMEQGALAYPVTMRQTLEWADLMDAHGMAASYAMAVLAKASDQDRGNLHEIAERHFGKLLMTCSVKERRPT